MKNFEERYTAWLDGAMDEPEREEFESGLDDRESALRDAAGWKKLRGLMRESLVPAAMPHADFVNSQVLAAIDLETPKPERPAAGWFPIGRLAWSGAFLLALAAVLTAVILPRAEKTPGADQFNSRVIAARASDPKQGVYGFVAPGGRGAVLWIQDAGDIPANERIK
jgi:anti-sigma factor RsiW